MHHHYLCFFDFIYNFWFSLIPNNWLRMSWPLTLSLTLHHYSYISKCSIPTAPQTFSPMPTSYWALNSWATFNVIGILNRNAYAEHAQEVQSCKTLFATRFYLQILNPCIDQLPIETKTRINNLVKTSSKIQFCQPITGCMSKIYQLSHPALNPCLWQMTLIPPISTLDNSRQ